MEKFRYLTILILGALLALTSCTDNEVERTRTLDVAQKTVTLNKDAQSQSVEITSNGELFSAEWIGEGWGKVEVDAVSNAIKIVVEKNSTPTLREASIIVSLPNGTRNSVIKVTQNGDNPILNVLPDHVTFDFMGGKSELEVTANAEWSLDYSEVEWLNVETHIKGGNIVVSAVRNTNTFARGNTFVVTAGNSSKEIEVRQDAGLLFIHPYLDFNNFNQAELEAFEAARYSGFAPGFAPFAQHKVFTKSFLIPQITYVVMGGNFMMAQSLIEPKYMDEAFDGKLHDIFLADGYEFLYRASAVDYYWLDYGPAAAKHCIVSANAKTKIIGYQGSDAKPNSPNTPTFKTFPYMPSEITWGMSQEDIKTWEAANNGTLNTAVDKEMFFDVSASTTYRMRVYYFADVKTNLNKTGYVFKETAKIALTTPVAGQYTINNNFEALLTSEGFTFAGTASGDPVYVNASKQVQCLIALMTITGENPVITYAYLEFRHYAGTRKAAETSELQLPNGFKLSDMKIKRSSEL